MSDSEKVSSLKLGTGWTRITVIGEPTVVLTFRGYAPVLPIRQQQNDLEYVLYVSAKSLAEPLEDLRKKNGNKFTGLDIEIRKASAERTAPYEVRNAAGS